MNDAEVRQEIVMRQVGHASPVISQRCNHPMEQAHLAAAGQLAALVRKARNRACPGRMLPFVPLAAVFSLASRDVPNVSAARGV